MPAGYLIHTQSSNMYYPFGSLQLGRYSQTAVTSRYGFQGQEKDNEIRGEGNSLNYKYRMHDARIGRFFALDPLSPEYPHNRPYAFSENRVIDAVELEGLESVVFHQITDTRTGLTVINVTRANGADLELQDQSTDNDMGNANEFLRIQSYYDGPGTDLHSSSMQILSNDQMSQAESAALNNHSTNSTQSGSGAPQSEYEAVNNIDGLPIIKTKKNASAANFRSSFYRIPATASINRQGNFGASRNLMSISFNSSRFSTSGATVPLSVNVSFTDFNNNQNQFRILDSNGNSISPISGSSSSGFYSPGEYTFNLDNNANYSVEIGGDGGNSQDFYGITITP